MKILHITPSYEPAWELGGVVRSVSLLCRGLARQGVDMTVFATDRGRYGRLTVPVNQEVELGGVKVWYFKTDFNWRFAYSRALRDALRRSLKEYDLVNFSTFWCYPGIPAGIECRKQRVPYVVFTHGTLADYALANKHFKKKIYLKLVEERNLQFADALRYTAELEREMTANLGLPSPTFIVPNGLDLAEFENLPSRSHAREKWGIDPNTQVILYIGRLVKGKGLDLLIKAFALAERILPKALLILAGPDSGLEKGLRKLVSSLKLESKVWFTGYVPPEKRNSLLRAADLLTLLSKGENFGNVAVEAMLAGVPVLISNKVGICREVEADGAGVVINLNQEAVAQALIDLLSDSERLEFLGQAAAIAARRRYDINLVSKQMVTAYEDILTGRCSQGLFWSGK